MDKTEIVIGGRFKQFNRKTLIINSISFPIFAPYGNRYSV